MSRRALLAGAAGLGATALLPRRLRAGEARAFRLVAAPARVALVGAPHPDTDVWCYQGRIPGPEIRARQGDRLSVELTNELPQETTVHWHGVRVPNAMDGVPHLTQPPIAPGATFTYEFDLPDAGTFWFHPHQRSFEQVERGLAGALIVEEREPIEVDRDVVWVLDDWRLRRDAAISDDFGNMMDVTHAGRVGNTVTVNGRLRDAFQVRAGERLRLRLINAANARIFALAFDGHAPQVIALDGQPVEPHRPDGDRVLLGPGQRADLVLDASHAPGARFAVTDTFYRGREYRLLDLAYSNEPALRQGPPAAPIQLPSNPLPEPDLGTAVRHEVVFAGGMMGGMTGGIVDGRPMDVREMLRHGLAWTLSGMAGHDHAHAPMLTLERGRSCVLAMHNETAWHHPMHLHGHVFRVLSRNGVAAARREWLDTVLVDPRERVEVAFVADNPGDWMFHCHVLEHQAGGMTGAIRVD
ncbi:MAG TPA: multicopper oxidase family protein [Microvirga sp.]|nr:multicopper oxidase family protein [Microvirga sp.]